MTVLLRLSASCPNCGWVPAKRITAAHARAVRNLAPTVVVDSLKCQNNRCGTIYEVTAKAYHEARAA